MAQIVAVAASTHNPRIFWNRDQADKGDYDAMLATFGEVREMLAATKPDTIVIVANDHLDNFFFDNLPTFAVGTGAEILGPFWYESEIMFLPHYRAAIAQELSGDLLRTGIEAGIAFSQAHELHVDHAVTVPLSFLRPQADLPVVPISTNVFGYPLAPVRRFYELGQFLRRALSDWPKHSRVAVIASFNLTVEVGGPKMGNFNRDFSDWILGLMREGRRDELLDLTLPKLIAQGNSTTELLNYIATLGIVEDAPPNFIRHRPVKGVGTCPIAFWKMG
jgi:protocatechuate 4,5-dioxygenase, beta chain